MPKIHVSVLPAKPSDRDPVGTKTFFSVEIETAYYGIESAEVKQPVAIATEILAQITDPLAKIIADKLREADNARKPS